MLVRRLAVAIGLLFALIGVQGPEFAQQYRQRLGGAIDELSRIVSEFSSEAARQSLTYDAAASRLETNPDPLARERGETAEHDRSRLDKLSDAFNAMRNDASLHRLWTLIVDFDPQIASRTLDNFEPAAPTTWEAFIVALVTGAIGWGLTHLGAWPVRRHLARRAEFLAQERREREMRA